MRQFPLAVLSLLTMGCATAKPPCDFDLHVRVTPYADEECWTAGARRADDGRFLGDRDRILGCALAGKIITNGTEMNMGHEMKHQMDRNCK